MNNRIYPPDTMIKSIKWLKFNIRKIKIKIIKTKIYSTTL